MTEYPRGICLGSLHLDVSPVYGIERRGTTRTSNRGRKLLERAQPTDDRRALPMASLSVAVTAITHGYEVAIPTDICPARHMLDRARLSE
jgi:hypothetical protein